MKYVLKIVKGNNCSSKFEILDGETYEIRRAKTKDREILNNSKNIFLDDEEISKLHAKLFMVKGELIIHDLGSTNGTLVNNKKIDKAMLSNSDLIRVGETELKVSKQDSTNDLTFIRKNNNYNKLTKNFKNFLKTTDDSFSFDPDITKLSFGDSNIDPLMNEVKELVLNSKDDEELRYLRDFLFEVEIVEGVDKGKKFRFYTNKILLGRVGDLIIEDALISREHVEIRLISNGLFKVIDLGSLNKTFINNKPIKLATFNEKDVLKVGNTSLKLKYLDV